MCPLCRQCALLGGEVQVSYGEDQDEGEAALVAMTRIIMRLSSSGAVLDDWVGGGCDGGGDGGGGATTRGTDTPVFTVTGEAACTVTPKVEIGTKETHPGQAGGLV